MLNFQPHPHDTKQSSFASPPGSSPETPCSPEFGQPPSQETQRRNGSNGNLNGNGRTRSHTQQADEENSLLAGLSEDEEDEENGETNGHRKSSDDAATRRAPYSSWMPAGGGGKPSPSSNSTSGGIFSYLYSACFTGGSMILNILLVLFLLWSHTQPHCIVTTVPSVADSFNTDPSAANVRDLTSKSQPKLEEPPSVVMPVFKEIEKPVLVTPVVQKQKPPTPVTPVPTPKQEDEDDVLLPKEEPSVPRKREEIPVSTPPPAATKETPKSSTPGVLRQPTPSTSLTTAPSSSKVDSFQSSFNPSTDHLVTWNYCPSTFALTPGINYKKTLMGAPPHRMCEETMKVEQHYQLTWFGGQVAVGYTLPQRFVPPFLDCIHLPPEGYKWPTKYDTLPCDRKEGCINWPNLRASTHEDLVEFNRGTPKNLYHFNAPVYDLDGFNEMKLLAKYVPLKTKVRSMFDIGAGGGSFGLLLKRKYNIDTLASAFADWPYCEYMAERGEMCLYLDVMDALPFAKGSYDLIHISWVYHGQPPHELNTFLYEVDRILRPGGYLYMRGGWSNVQIASQRQLLAELGYTLLYEDISHKLASLTNKISFGEGLPYHADWTAIYVKPIKGVPASTEECEKRVEVSKKWTEENLVTPIPKREFGTQQGNVYKE